MNGAQSLIRTLVDHGVDTCFMNPGTSEMHFVAALDDVPAMRGVLALFEGVATGAADGYARIAGRPAATLLHLGPGLGNGLANLHNARRAHSPVLAVVGDHAVSHRAYDAQLQSDIATVARNVSTFVRTTESTPDLGRDAVDALVAAHGPPGIRGHRDPAGRRVVVRGRRGGAGDGRRRHPAGAGRRTRCRRGRDGGGGPALRRAHRAAHRWPGVFGPAARCRRRSGRRHRCRTPAETFPARHGPGRRAARRSSGSATWPSSP